MSTKNNDIKIKSKIDDEKINFYSCCIDCSFKKSENIDKQTRIDLLKRFKIYIKQCFL